MKITVIGTRYRSFSPISILTEACAASRGVSLPVILFPPACVLLLPRPAPGLDRLAHYRLAHYRLSHRGALTNDRAAGRVFLPAASVATK
jgi:hypothetical protein